MPLSFSAGSRRADRHLAAERQRGPAGRLHAVHHRRRRRALGGEDDPDRRCVAAPAPAASAAAERSADRSRSTSRRTARPSRRRPPCTSRRPRATPGATCGWSSSTAMERRSARTMTAPFTFDWSGVGPGTYALTAKATDNGDGVHHDRADDDHRGGRAAFESAADRYAHHAGEWREVHCAGEREPRGDGVRHQRHGDEGRVLQRHDEARPRHECSLLLCVEEPAATAGGGRKQLHERGALRRRLPDHDPECGLH